MTKSRYSYATTWIIRILLALIVLIIFSILMLSNMGGTSENHKRGLEQAFSESLKADIEIRSIEKFNIMPQLALEITGIHGVFRDTKNEFMADNVQMAFGLMDMLIGRTRIENFSLKNFRFSKDSAYDFKIDMAAIQAGEKPHLIINGHYDGKNFNVGIPLVQEKGTRVSYYFAETNHFEGRYGGMDISGDLVPFERNGDKIIRNIKLDYKGKLIAEGEGVREGESFLISLNCQEKPDMATSEFAAIRKIPNITLSESCPK